MNKTENLLVTLSEEATEILIDIKNNVTITYELNDLFAVVELLNEFNIIDKVQFSDIRLNIEEVELELLKLQYFISKALRFGLSTHNNNSDKILNSLSRILSSFPDFIDREKIENKKIKVAKYMKYSIELKTLDFPNTAII